MRLVWLVLLGTLVGCAGVPPGDGEPLYRLSAAEVVEPVPVPVIQRAAGNTSPYQINGQAYHVMESGRGYRETGFASWYGRKFHGRRTANGEVFNAYRASAAHRSLPLPAYVRVTNLENQRSMIVRVNDRGPFHPDRIIDLSYAAAVKLGFADQGTARVEVEAIDVAGSRDLRPGAQLASAADARAHHYHFIQVGAFSERERAESTASQLRAQLDATVSVSEALLGDRVFYRVRLGPVTRAEQLVALHDQILALGYPEARMMPK
ncbi:MAG: septal ring lytic transglycosylase RlpA family protein [Halieaceae bacterium]|nr:septal ring lytic transglycosylase RlpA family protein [Halieaceae bacterium]